MKLLFILLLGLGFSQTELTTRLYEVDMELYDDEEVSIDLNAITGYDLENPILYLQFIDVDIFDNNDNIGIQYKSEYVNAFNGVTQVTWNTFAYVNIDSHIWNANHTHPMPQDDTIILKADRTISGTFGFSITADFPQEDTGYIEDGFEFCLTPGANLLSFPCDSPINVGESLPQGVENFITEIVGQGVAASYNPALGWIGNLAEFTPGSGYWFKSNESLCFEYDCVED